MQASKEKFIIDVEKLKNNQISVLRAIQREGEKHLKYYHTSMSAFKYPELRLKTFETKYYEEVLPIITEILEQKGLLVK